MKIIVSGRIQGVGFRYWLKGKFMELGIDGKVWNNDDGTVGVEFSAGSDPSKKLLGMLKQGPPLARVDKVTILKE
ncbi:hypothetical protein A3E73_03000 [Candidatus Beckwithbacteria bacterium RIFCSPHIGHO2_12_FULL_47_17]|uniref:acylphosphatase n=1 Tax=Candidatus Beckwithbacteria bacterium RIFCSPHIGHO2_12_FULL_47_17 TaxID=1797460 RepID=A0A1F5DJX8_9BACT|nr:MAG: hypothetical protein A3E73_03000 [Candidatus Beckwithbacteria bacterium RIFCSPHIGHO2_12_FULL_47_17]